MDFHAEQLIIKQKKPSDYLLAAGILLVTVILWIFIYTFLFSFATLASILIVLAGWGAFKLIQMLNIEYEYELTNHYLDIDKIMGKARRKRIVTIDFRNAEQCTYISAPEFSNKHGIEKTYDLSGNLNADGCAFVDFLDDGKRIRVIFRPNDKIKEYIKKAAPKAVKL